MRAVIQRVTRASVTVNGGEPRAVGPGLVILLGVRDTDDSAIVPKLAEKCAHLRIFEDEDGKLNRSSSPTSRSTVIRPGANARASSMPPRASWPCRAMKNSSRR